MGKFGWQLGKTGAGLWSFAVNETLTILENIDYDWFVCLMGKTERSDHAGLRALAKNDSKSDRR